MAFVPGYQCDIFISYAHNDDLVIGQHPGWVEVFHQTLESWLAKRRGLGGLVIWRDCDLDGATRFDDTIAARISGSALFFALYSHNFRKSEYCLGELERFAIRIAQSPVGERIGERSRVFNVLLDDIAHCEWHRSLKGSTGFPMFENTGSTADLAPANGDTYREQLGHIVNSAQAALEELKRQVTPEDDAPSPSTKTSVFLANVPATLADSRDRLVAELFSRTRLLANTPPPEDSVGHSKRVQALLDSAQLSVHLLDRESGAPIKDERESSYPRRQAELAMVSKTPALIWIPDTLNTGTLEDSDYERWLRGLGDSGQDDSGYNIVRSAPHELPAIVVDRVAHIESLATPEVPSGSCLIDTHRRDQTLAFLLAHELGKHKFDVQFNQESPDPMQSLASFKAAVRSAASLVIVYGHVAKKWVDERINLALKVFVEQLDTERAILERIIVYQFPGHAQRYEFKRASHLIKVWTVGYSGRGDPDPPTVQDLLELLRAEHNE